LVEQGYDPAIAWPNLLLENVGDGKPLGRLNSDALGDFGASLDDTFYPGLPEMFEEIRDLVDRVQRRLGRVLHHLGRA
jgi:hypothetical protein